MTHKVAERFAPALPKPVTNNNNNQSDEHVTNNHESGGKDENVKKEVKSKQQSIALDEETASTSIQLQKTLQEKSISIFLKACFFCQGSMPFLSELSNMVNTLEVANLVSHMGTAFVEDGDWNLDYDDDESDGMRNENVDLFPDRELTFFSDDDDVADTDELTLWSLQQPYLISEN